MRFLGFLAVAQLRRHRARWGLLAAGVMVVVALPIGSAALSRSVDAQTVRQTIAGLDLSDRTLLVNQDGGSALHHGNSERNDAIVRHELARLTGDRVVHESLFRPLIVKGSPMIFAGADDLGDITRLVAGRLPTSCTRQRCDVVSLGATTAATRQAAATLGVDVVGQVARRSPVLVSGQLDPGRTPVLLSSGAGSIAALGSLALYSRHDVWAGLVDPGRVVSLGVPAWVDRSIDTGTRIDQRIGGASLDAPTTELQAAATRADASSRRLGLLGAFGAVLLVGFALVAAVALRREAQLLVSLLSRRGATGRQVAVVTALQATAGGAIGAAAGFVLGGVVASTATAGTGVGPLAVAGRAVADGAPAAIALTVASIAVVTAVLLWPDAQERNLRRSLDLAALACLGAAVLAAGRGDTSAGSLSTGQDPLVIALPVLACVVAGLATARVWPPAIGAVQRLLPRRSIAARIGLLGSLRSPLRPLVTAGFLAAAITAVVFAGAYRSTLLANDADQAAYQVPLDVTLAASPQVLVPDVAADAFGPHVDVFGVLRGSVSVAPQPGVVNTIPLVAPDVGAFGLVNRWERTTGSDVAASTLARRLTTRLPNSPALPPGARSIAIAASGVDFRATTLGLWVRTADGHQTRVGLRLRDGRLVGTLPRGRGAATPVAFGVDESFDHKSRHSHVTGEGSTDVPVLAGTVRLGAMSVDGRTIPWSWDGWGSANGTVRADASSLALRYRIDGALVVAVPNYSSVAGAEVPVAVDPQTARGAQDGHITLTVDSSTKLAGNIVAVLPRLPTVAGPFVLAARGPLLAALDLDEPGRNPTEFWVAGASPQLSKTIAATRMTVTSRASVQADLDADPVGRGARELLIFVAILGLAVATVALALLVVGERRDGAGEMYAWEADGVPPSVLRRMLAFRALAVAVVAVPTGVVAGVVVARAGATLIAVGATGTSPTPPLQVTIGSVWTVVILAAGIGAGLLLSLVVALLSLRERHPVPARTELR